MLDTTPVLDFLPTQIFCQRSILETSKPLPPIEFCVIFLFLHSYFSIFFFIIDKTTPNPTIAAQLTANSERTAKEYEELRRRIAVEAMCLSQRVPRVRQQVMHEQERINRLAEVYQVKCCNVFYYILFVYTYSY